MNIIFKQHLKVFLKDHMDMEERFVREIDDCRNYSELKDFLSGHGTDIAEALGVDLDEDCEDCKDKDQEISDASDYIIELECKLEEFPEFKTLDESRKLEAFMEHHHKYNATEMDQLLK